MQKLRKLFGTYELIAFATGFALMAYELAASRILAPSVGSSTYVWTSVIGVMIAALAAGYAFGGWLADKRVAAGDIAWLLVMSAVAMVGTLTFYPAILAGLDQIFTDSRLQGIAAAILLFMPASFILGTISPYLARLRVQSVTTTGRSIAMLSAFNSLGGISGTFCAGFIFFTYLGSRETLILLIVLLAACSWLVLPRYRWKARAAVMAVMVLIIGLQLSPPVTAGTVASIDTASSHYDIKTTQYNGREVRVLLSGPHGAQSGVFTDGSKELAFPYARQIASVVAAAPHKDNILILGGGAFTLPEYFATTYPSAQVDVVEIDPQLPDISATYFGYQPKPNIRTFSEDARSFLERNTTTYDIVIIDVFSDISVPFALTTREYAQALAKSVSFRGQVVANIIGSLNSNCRPALAALHHAYAQQFDHSKLLDLGTPQQRIHNITAVYGRTALDWVPGQAVNGSQLPAGRLFTDNHAPVEHMWQKCHAG